jgi:hypothetical protein
MSMKEAAKTGVFSLERWTSAWKEDNAKRGATDPTGLQESSTKPYI